MLPSILDFGVVKLGNVHFPLRIHGYGLMLVLGFLVGLDLAKWRARRVGENPETISHCCILALVGGIIGARIAYAVQH